MSGTIAARRLLNQRITQRGLRRPEEVIAWLGAVQAQEYAAAKWGVGLRMRDGTVDADVERAFEQGRILRTHVMRPTWHFVNAADIRWLLELTAPRVQRAMSSYLRQLELDPRTLSRGAAIFERALRDRQYLTRAELGERLGRAKIVLDGVRLAHVAMHAELAGVICSGPRRGKLSTYALLAERAPGARPMERDASLAELTRRYFRSHGPATIRDFVWWSGLTTADAKRGLEMCRAAREEAGGLTYWTIDGPRTQAVRDRLVHLLPIYDEYVVAYRDRQAVPHGPAAIAPASKESVTFQHALVIDGHVAGTWRTTRRAQAIQLQTIPLRPLSGRERRALADAVERYERFAGTPVISTSR